MTIAERSLLVFTVWTILVPLGAVGYYRWSRIVTGTGAINGFSADATEGPDWYRRAMRAHANCVENLPVFGALVVLGSLHGVASRHHSALAVTVAVARVAQSSVHMAFVQTERVVGVRFTCFFIQVICMLAMAVDLAIAC
jgi:uncharacterized MAPEG superfamily protein